MDGVSDTDPNRSSRTVNVFGKYGFIIEYCSMVLPQRLLIQNFYRQPISPRRSDFRCTFSIFTIRVCTLLLSLLRRSSFLSLSPSFTRPFGYSSLYQKKRLVSKKSKSLGTNPGILSDDTDVAPSCNVQGDLSVCVPSGADRHVSFPLPDRGTFKTVPAAKSESRTE